MKRRTALSLLATLPGATSVLRAQPRTRVVYGYTGATDFASVFVAAEQGFFDARGLDVELRLIPLNSTIPAAIESGSLQLGGPTVSVFLQAAEGGLDHVAVAGSSVTTKSNLAAALLARPGTGIRTARDCVGRRIGVPGLGAFLHITMLAWLTQQGVAHREVRFIETPLAQQNDLLRGGSVDAVVTGEPFLSRIVDSGAGYVVAYHTTFLRENMPIILHAARRDWALANSEALRAFRESVQQGARFALQPANDAAVRAAIGKYTRLPPAVMARVQISRPDASITAGQLRYWIDLMASLDLLRSPLEAGRLVVPGA